MADYAVYFDDSGHPLDQPFVVIAGFAASEAQWIAFEGEWERALDASKVAKPFHSMHPGKASLFPGRVA